MAVEDVSVDDARYEAARALMHTAGELAGEYFARIWELEVHSKGTQDVVT